MFAPKIAPTWSFPAPINERSITRKESAVVDAAS